MPSKMVLSGTESRVLDMLPRGSENPIQTITLMNITGISRRGLLEIVNRLISKGGIPIVSIRSGESFQRGLYIATNDIERIEGLVSLTNQTHDMAHRIEAVKAADLNGWQQNIIRPYIDEEPKVNIG